MLSLDHGWGFPQDTEFDLTTLDQYFDVWKKKAASKNVDISGSVTVYQSFQAQGEMLRNRQTKQLPMAAIASQKRLRTVLINKIIFDVATEEIKQTVKAAANDPRFKSLMWEIRDDAKYLYKMLESEEKYRALPLCTAESRYYRVNAELQRLTEKVISKVSP